MLKLHYAPRTISVAVAIALEETGTPYEAILVDFSKDQQNSAAYAAVNPKGRVPALETPDGILTETPALLEYAVPSLVPADPYAAAKMRELMSYLNSTMHPFHAHGLRGIRWADQEASFADMKQKVPANMAASCVYLEEFLPGMPFPLGQMQTLADAYLYVVLTWLKGDGVDINDYPLLTTFQNAMAERPSVRAVYDKGMF